MVRRSPREKRSSRSHDRKGAMTARIIDGDQHLHEPRTMWRDHIDPSLRDAALAIEDDELGYAWLTWRGARLYPAEIQMPGKASLIGKERLRMEAREPAEASYDELLPPERSEEHRVGKECRSRWAA